MNRKFKKVIALLMAVVMCLSVGFTAFAWEIDDDSQSENTQQNMNRVTGEGGRYYGKDVFDPSKGTDYDDETFHKVTETTAIEGKFPDVYPNELFDKDPLTNEEVQELIDAILPVMTYEEKIQMISANGSDDPERRNGVGYIDGVPRLGIPETRMNDGPAGINSLAPKGFEVTNPPNQLSSSNSWDTELEYAYGATLAKEHQSNGIGWQLGTQLDIARTPFFARIKDTFGEDYFLAGKMGIAEVSGLQETGGAMSMSKHIGAYSTDGDVSLWIEVDEQTLHQSYLQTFEAVAKEAQLASIMGTYNRLNGLYTSSNKYLQLGVLRNMWNYQGAMVPDWGADKESFSMLTGSTILQGDGPSIDRLVRSAVSQKLMTMDDVDNFVSTALYAYGVAGFLNLVQIDPETGLAMEEPGRTEPIVYGRTYVEDRLNGLYEASNDVVLKMAEESIVLAKNENDALPITAEDYTGDNSVALIGYGAVSPITGTGGERADGVGQYMSSPYESIVDIVGEEANIDAYVTNDKHGSAIPEGMIYQTADGTENGWVDAEGNVYDSLLFNPEVRGDIVNGENGNALEPLESKKLTGYFEAAETGTYKFCLWYTNGTRASVSIDGARQTDRGGGYDYQTLDGSSYTTISVNMVAGERYKITVGLTNSFDFRVASYRLNYMTPNNDINDYAAAKEAAATHDTVIMFTRTGATGHGPVFRTDYDISLAEKEQVAEIAKIAKDNGNKFVLVVYSRSAFTFEGDWYDNTDALLLPFYPGQAGGTAIAKIITGVVNPSGKTTVTFPKRSEDTLLTYGLESAANAWSNPTDLLLERAGDMRTNEFTAKYTEGLSFGYHWYDETGIEPQIAFGNGLSYTTFEYSDYDIKTNEDGKTVDVTVTVTNTGDVTGSEIVQVYVGAPQNVPEDIQTVEKQLAGFARINDLAPGESKTVTMTIAAREFSYWDPMYDLIKREDGTMDKWILGEGERTIWVGSSSDNLLHEETVVIDDHDDSTPGKRPLLYHLEAPETVETGAEITVTAQTEDDVVGFALKNENGGNITIKSIESVKDEAYGTKNWTIKFSVGTPGSRTLELIPASAVDGYIESVKFNIEVTAVVEPESIASAEFAAKAVAKNSPVDAKISTGFKVTNIAIQNEKRSNMGKTLVSKVRNGNGTIDWTYSIKIGTVGDRTFYAVANRNVETSTPMDIIVVY